MAIPIDMFVPDQIDLTITGEQVSDRLAGADALPRVTMETTVDHDVDRDTRMGEERYDARRAAALIVRLQMLFDSLRLS